MKKLSIVVLMVAGLVGLGARAAHAGGASICEIGVSSGTNIVPCAVNNGAALDLTLFQVAIETGAAADVCVCFDSAAVSGLVVGNDGVNANSAPRVGAVSVVATNTTTTEPAGTVARNAVNGLMCGKSNANGRCSVRFKKQ